MGQKSHVRLRGEQKILIVQAVLDEHVDLRRVPPPVVPWPGEIEIVVAVEEDHQIRPGFDIVSHSGR